MLFSLYGVAVSEGQGVTRRMRGRSHEGARQGATRHLAILDGGGGDVWRRAAILTHTIPVCTFEFLYTHCNSQQAQLVGVIALESLLFRPHGGGSTYLTVFSSTCPFSLRYLRLRFSTVSPPGRFPRGDLHCAGHIRRPWQELRNPMYSKNYQDLEPPFEVY